MAQWERAWDFLSHGHDVRDVGGLNSTRGTRCRSCSSNQAIGKVFSAEYAIYCKFSIIKLSPLGVAVNYKPYASPSFQMAKPRKITVISAIIIYYY